MAAKYLTMVGQLQLLVTLGRFDIHAQVATMSMLRGVRRHVRRRSSDPDKLTDRRMCS